MEETGNVDNASELLDQLTVVEGIAEEILSDRQEITDLDRKRNKTREATRCEILLFLMFSTGFEKCILIFFPNLFISFHVNFR